LDTNVVSEWVKLRPNPHVVQWLAEVDEDRVFLSVVTLAELRHGVDRMPAGARRQRLDEWVRHDLTRRFADRILPIDMAIADTWGALMATREQCGRSLTAMDAFIAATATVRGLTLVTRNAQDFAMSVPAILNPWGQ
jgi:predicted nucleic acid-binding protein